MCIRDRDEAERFSVTSDGRVFFRGRVYLIQEDGKMCIRDRIDGVHVNDDDGWVLVRPNKNFTACRVIAGSFKEEYAEELSLIYEQKLRSIIAEGRVEK